MSISRRQFIVGSVAAGVGLIILSLAERLAYHIEKIG